MREVLAESPEDLHGLLLETADYWLSLGLAIGLLPNDCGPSRDPYGGRF